MKLQAYSNGQRIGQIYTVSTMQEARKVARRFGNGTWINTTWKSVDTKGLTAQLLESWRK